MIHFLFAAFLLAQQDQTPRPGLKIDPVYFDLAANTGGDFYFWAPGEFAAARLQVPVHHEDVVLSYGSIQTEKTFDIPVESHVKELTVFAGIERKDLAVLVRPDGTVLRDVQSFQHMLIATVKAPAVGIWRLELHGAGTYAVTAHVKPADDGPDLVRFAFVEPGGRLGHEGMFPVKRVLVASETLACEVSVSGSISGLELLFVGRDGSPVKAVPVAASDNGEYAARCTVPDVPFRAAIRGRDSSGATFERVESPLRTPGAAIK